jgi:hypothetical protein
MRNRINFLELEFKCSVIDEVDPRQGEVQIPENVAIPNKGLGLLSFGLQ